MNLHGYHSEESVIETAYDLLRSRRLVYESGRWWWSEVKTNPAFSNRRAQPFDSVLRQAELTPEKLQEKFGAREFVC